MSSVHSVAQIKCRFSNDEFKLIVRALTDTLKDSEFDQALKLGNRLMEQLIKDESHRLDVLKKALSNLDDDDDDGEGRKMGEVPMPEVTYLRPGSGSGGYGGPAKSNDLC